MSWQGLANMVSVCLGFIASLFFCWGSAEMKTGEIQKLAGTFWGANPHLRSFLVALKADYLSGGLMLCGAFALQFFASWPGFLSSVPVMPTALGVGGAILVTVCIAAIFVGYKRYVVRSLSKELASTPVE